MQLDRDLPLLVVLAVSFASAIFFAAAETALLRISPVRAATLVDEERRGAHRLQDLLEALPRVLSAILLVALLSQITAATVTGILADRWFGSLGVTVASIGLTVLLFIYGEAIPKTFAVQHPDRVALTVAPVVGGVSWLLRPIVAVLVWIADLQMPGEGIETAPTVTESELLSLASVAAGEGEITEVDQALIQRAFRFGDQRADDIMVPRPDVVAVAADLTVDRALERALDAGHRRLLVFEGILDDAKGLVRLRTMVQVPEETRSTLHVGALVEPCLVVPESKRVFELLSDMQDDKTHLAVVVDEYGSTAGIITVEDIAEELLGSMTEDGGEQPIVAVEPGVWSVDAATTVVDLTEQTGLPLPEGEWNTVAGLVLGLAGRVPEVGDFVETERARLRVRGLRRHRITRVEVSDKRATRQA